ncbi:MAG: alanine--tRNA ligase [Nanobdellota archaeon]
MEAKKLKQLYLEFFNTKNHKILPSSSLIPENDPTVLFTTAGMHPLVPFLMGQPHPLGKRLADVQKCIRTGDIDEVGDSCHHTFFEMLGNWSLGDYFKKESIKWSYEFLTEWLKLEKEKIAVSCFQGDETAPKDNEAAEIWGSLGINKITYLDKKENWWGPAGTTGPCGPDTEIFYWASKEAVPESFNPDDDRWVEIWNNVFMQYNKKEDGKYHPLEQKNVDTGLGVERVSAILQGYDDNYLTERFWPIIEYLQNISEKEYSGHKKEMRVIADHLRSAVFILGDERTVTPSNIDQGYILRRFIRRAIRNIRELGIKNNICKKIGKIIIEKYSEEYPGLKEKKDFIENELIKEEEKFTKTLTQGLKEFERLSHQIISNGNDTLSGKKAFLLFQSYGFPLEMSKELAKEKNLKIDEEEFNKEYEKHQELSRKGAQQKFKGGLSESSEITKKYHTATHLLNEALRRLVDSNISQKGSNITPERLRFDFNFDRPLTEEEKKKVEDEVNKTIQEGHEITCKEMSPEEAKEKGAQAEFGTRYPPKVWVYSIGNYSFEICMGPHVNNTKELGHFKIKKEQSSAAGIRRIKAVLE